MAGDALDCDEVCCTAETLRRWVRRGATRGDGYENASADTINGPCEAEVTRRLPVAFVRSRRMCHARTDGLVQQSPPARPIRNITPAEPEANYYAAIEDFDMAA
jgi:putative transposase